MMENNIYKICEDILGITDEEIRELLDVANKQLTYLHPLKMGTAKRQHELGTHNKIVTEKIVELRDILRDGANI